MKRFYSKKITDSEYGEFDSITEYDRFLFLLNLQNKGEIKNLERQTQIVLQEKFKLDGVAIRSITYKPDYTYVDSDGIYNIEDVKGYEVSEEVFKIKFKMCKNLIRDAKYKIMVSHKGIWYDIDKPNDKKIYMEAKKSKKNK